MRSSMIVDPGRRPASPLMRGVYASQPSAVLAAIGRVSIATGVPAIGPGDVIDTSVYEFPGDATYARYLQGGAQ